MVLPLSNVGVSTATQKGRFVLQTEALFWHDENRKCAECSNIKDCAERDPSRRWRRKAQIHSMPPRTISRTRELGRAGSFRESSTWDALSAHSQRWTIWGGMS